MPTRRRDPRTEILHVRLTPAERERLRVAAVADYADESAWARAAILKALDSSGPPPETARSPGRPPEP